MADEVKRRPGRPRKVEEKKYNPKSRDNLRQFAKVKTAAKVKKAVRSIIEEVNIEIDPTMLETIIPTDSVFTPTEKERFIGFLRLYMNEFGRDSALSISDIDDIAQLCMNRIMETRLYEKVKKGDNSLPDVSNALDKYKKDTAKLKDQLAANRSVRIDPRAGKDVTVLDVLYEYDKRATESHTNDLIEKMTKAEQEVAGTIKSSREEMIT